MELNWGQLVHEISRSAERTIERYLPNLPPDLRTRLATDIAIDSATWLCQRQMYFNNIPTMPTPRTQAALESLHRDNRPSLRRRRLERRYI